MIKRLQNRIAESRYSLPVVAVYSVTVMLVAGIIQHHWWAQGLLVILSTELMAYLNNGNALIRVYSRMVSCAFAALTVAATFMLPSLLGALAGTGFVLMYIFLFRAYQHRQGIAPAFIAFAIIGTISVAFVQVLYLLPVFFFVLVTNLMAGGRHNFFAALLGVMMPYWFLTGYYAYIGNFDLLPAHFAALGEFGPVACLDILSVHQTVTLCWVVILAIIGGLHFLATSYLDKIRVRMLFYSFITVDVCALVFIILQPQHYDYLMRLIIISSAPLAGHYFALTHSRLSGIVFWAAIAITFLLTVWNLWI